LTARIAMAILLVKPGGAHACAASRGEHRVPKRTMTFDLRHPPQFATSNRDLYAAALDII
jgi:hypothetical protein